MASSSSSSAAGPRQAAPAPAAARDAILRNALRYTISAREYAALHKYILSRSRVLKKRAPSVDTVNRIMNGERPAQRRSSSAKDAAAAASAAAAGKNKGKKKAEPAGAASGEEKAALAGADDFNARAVRHSVRVFLATGIAMKLWEAISARLTGKTKDSGTQKKKQPLYKSPTLRLSLSLSTILLLYRLLFRFFTRLRTHLLDPSALPFRQRNPRTAAALTSPYAPAVGASLAGLALGIYPAAPGTAAGQYQRSLRVTVAIYAVFRALEFAWNAAEDAGALWGRDPRTGRPRARPSWWGSWMLQPLASGQLLHAVVFDRDCFPPAYGDFIFSRTTAYLHPRPADAPPGVRWPGAYDVVDALATMAKANWPPFSSPVLFPTKESAAALLPPALAAVEPLTSSAHPLITSLSCATLHPSDPSCARTFLTFWLRSFPAYARVFLLLYTALGLPRLALRAASRGVGSGSAALSASLYHAPLSTLFRAVVLRALRTATFVTGALSTAWASICFFQAWLPRRFLATQRFFLGGFLAGFWAWTERRHGRPVFLYSARASVDSLWKVGVKRRWWRALRGGDVWVFALALLVSGVVYERDARAVRETSWRKGISWVRGEGWRDWAVEDEDEIEGEGADEGGEGGEGREVKLDGEGYE